MAGRLVTTRAADPGDSPPRKRVRRAVGEASTSTNADLRRPPAPPLRTNSTAPLPRVCPHCSHPTTHLRHHIAASKTCARRHAQFAQNITRNLDITTPKSTRRPYDPPDEDIYPDIPIEEQEPYTYDIDKDYATVERLRDMGILPLTGFELVPRLREMETSFAKSQRLGTDLDMLLQDLAPHIDDDASDAGDFDPDPFPDHDDDPPLSPRLINAAPPLPPPIPLLDNLQLPKNHVGDDLYTNNLFSLKFTANRAGKPILVDNRPKKCGDAYQEWEKAWKLKESECPFRPFQNLMEWEICQWAMLSGPSKFSADWLFNIPTVSSSAVSPTSL